MSRPVSQFDHLTGGANHMKLFITGISGLLGLNIACQAKGNFEVIGCYNDSPIESDGVEAIQLDLRDSATTESVIRSIQPDLILHTAALANVDQCEADPAAAQELNVTVAQNVAAISNSIGAKFVHISTDQLFDGKNAWRTEEDTAKPINVYGASKLAAETVVMAACPTALIARTNFYGWGTSLRKSFSDWILDGLEQSRELNLFTDVFYTPILINDLTEIIFNLVDHGATGIYNVCGSERLSKHEFGLKLVEAFGYSTNKINRSTVSSVSLQAARPSEMSLNTDKTANLLNIKLPMVSEGLRRLKCLQKSGWPKVIENARRGELGSQSF